MGNKILMVGDDGSVYSIDSGDMSKVAKKVPHEKLSADAQAHISENAGKAGGGSAYFFASKADFFVAGKADFFVAGTADFFVSGDD